MPLGQISAVEQESCPLGAYSSVFEPLLAGGLLLCALLGAGLFSDCARRFWQCL